MQYVLGKRAYMYLYLKRSYDLIADKNDYRQSRSPQRASYWSIYTFV